MKRPDLIGQRFGRLAVISLNKLAKPRATWICVCDCGNTVELVTNRLTSGNTQSCGCFQREFSSTNNRKHGGHGTPEYVVWAAMIQRCTNPNHTVFEHYGGRGIKVCDRWHNFSHFISDMGQRPSAKHSIDRVNSDGDYEPSNCRWAEIKTQLANRSCSRNYTLNGETKSLSDWARHIGISKASMSERIARWGFERAISTPKIK